MSLSSPPSFLVLRLCKTCRNRLANPPRRFSSTPWHPRQNRQREAMFRWLNGPGRVFRDPLPGSTNYLSAYDKDGRLIRVKDADNTREARENENAKSQDEAAEDAPEVTGKHDGEKRTQLNYAVGKGMPRETEEDLVPFPHNPQFRSQAVLSEELKEVVWHLVIQKGVSVRKVSATYQIDMRRVAAVVRLKEVEKQWEREGKRLATPYNRAVLAMLPQTPFKSPPQPHESINDLPVHKATVRQLFHPVPESRHFTRADAGQAFEKGLLSADQRIQHPELVSIEKARLSGRVADEAINAEWEKAEQADSARRAAVAAKKRRREDAMTTVNTGRWDFRFQEVSVDQSSVGKHVAGIGQRYGFPAQDRKKGQVKIPTSVG